MDSLDKILKKVRYDENGEYSACLTASEIVTLSKSGAKVIPFVKWTLKRAEDDKKMAMVDYRGFILQLMEI
jgi:hypothetical protein